MPSPPAETGSPTERWMANGKVVLDWPGDNVARLTLSRPAKLNSIDHDVLDGLTEALARLDRPVDVRCVVITGAGRAFSAGYDIADIPEESFARDAESLVAHPFHSAMRALHEFPFPVVAAINGHCLGGGLELAVQCDLRIAAASAKLGMPAGRLGLVYGHTGLRAFLDVIGLARTKELFLTGRNLSARQAHEIGLVHDVVPDDQIEAVTLQLASQIAGNSPVSLRAPFIMRRPPGAA